MFNNHKLKQELANAKKRLADLEWRPVEQQPRPTDGDAQGQVFVYCDRGRIALRRVTSWPWPPDFRTSAIVTHWRPTAPPSSVQPVVFSGREAFESFAHACGWRVSASLVNPDEYDRPETQAAWITWRDAKLG